MSKQQLWLIDIKFTSLCEMRAAQNILCILQEMTVCGVVQIYNLYSPNDCICIYGVGIRRTHIIRSVFYILNPIISAIDVSNTNNITKNDMILLCVFCVAAAPNKQFVHR